MLFSVGMLALVLAGVLYAVWSGFAKPLLGSMGLVEYKSKTQVRYEKFMESTVGCKEQKTVMSGNGSAKYPAFQLFVCPTGEEKIWSHKVEVVRKIANDKWVLE